MRIPILIFLAAIALAPTAFPQSTDEKNIVIGKPFSQDQLAIYRVVLNGWMENQKHPVHLSIETLPLDPSDATDCAPDLKLEPALTRRVHRFRAEDLPYLGLPTITLVNPEEQSEEVTKNDPHTNIRKGTRIEDAVSNGFAHGMVSLGEIRFDKDHIHAIVWYGFTCGSLCGNGGTELLEKKHGRWGIQSQCGHWVS